MRVRCETCPIQDFCPTIGTMVCPLLKLLEKLKEEIETRKNEQNKEVEQK